MISGGICQVTGRIGRLQYSVDKIPKILQAARVDIICSSEQLVNGNNITVAVSIGAGLCRNQLSNAIISPVFLAPFELEETTGQHIQLYNQSHHSCNPRVPEYIFLGRTHCRSHQE